MPERSHFLVFAAVVLMALPEKGMAQAFGGRDRGPGFNSPYAAPGYNNAPGAGMAPGYGMVPMAPEQVSMAADPSRKLQQGDQLLIKIEEDRELAVPLVVSQTGDVLVEPLPQAVRVANLTVSQAASEIKRQLDRDYYYNATVRLTLERASATASGNVTLSGQVNRVGALPVYADRPMTVSQAVLAVGGFRPFADDRRVKVTRLNRSGVAETFSVDVKEILKSGRVDLDRPVQDGDRIFVPEVFIKR